VEIQGIDFCEPCAREQEAYFALGEVTQETQSLRSTQLAEALERLRRERTGGTTPEATTREPTAMMDSGARDHGPVPLMPGGGRPEKLRAGEEAGKAVFVEKMVGARNKSRELTPPWQEC
jgi:hypothetical protein